MSESTSTKKRQRKTYAEYIEYRRKMARESQRKRRIRAKEQGLCSICVKNPATEGYATCEQCYARVRIWQVKHKESNHGQK